MNRIIIQDEISITREEFNKVVDHYRGMPDAYGLGIGGKMLDKDGIIKEIKDFTEIGKAILLMRYRFEKWESKVCKHNPPHPKEQD